VVSENADLFLVAESDSCIVGMIIGGWDGWRGNIYRLVVLPAYQRKGIARALVLEIEHRLVAKGARRLTLYVEHEHPDAVGFWDFLAAQGYSRNSRVLRYVKTL
jgi:ribosomal protein S18 acetylase RimI-like enzyme